MARSIWNGVVSFGMVSIPVSMSPATGSKDIAFNELHKVCKSRLKRPRMCPQCAKEVTGEEVVKAYEYAKGQYVEMTEDDFEKVPVPSKHTIQIVRFVNASEIDPVFYDAAYTLEPGELGGKPFALFMHALHKKGLVAIANITIRKREQLCALRPLGNNLILETLYYADEVRVDVNKEAGQGELSDIERNMAEALVDLLAGSFDAKEYSDSYRDALLQVISAKLEGKEVVTAPEQPAQVMDLMEALRASIEEAKARRAS